MSFDSLGLTPELVRVVADEGYAEPTPVQRQAIPLVLAGRDLLAGAQTGTGKTAAFVLPLLQRLHATSAPDRSPREQHVFESRAPKRPVRALVLAPTRELALQVEASVRTYGRTRPIRSVAIYGGVGFDPQVRALRAGPSIVVATPGRLLDHVGQRTIDLGQVEVLVLDEADRMLDMGFIRDIRRVLALLPVERQNLLFSATFSDEIRSLAGGLLRQPAMVDVAPRNRAAELVEQVVIPVDRDRKRELLTELVRSGRIRQALVFTRTKHGANKLAEQLERDGLRAAAIHGNKSQAQRVRALEDFKAGRVDLLVATDIAARGIDIDGLPHVVNFELPMVASDYIHRIGRTGRAGVGGDALSLVCIDEAGLQREIERLLGRPLPTEIVAGFEPDRTARPEPIRLRTGVAGQRAPAGQRSPGGLGRSTAPHGFGGRPASGARNASRGPARSTSAAVPFRAPAWHPERDPRSPHPAAGTFRGKGARPSWRADPPRPSFHAGPDTRRPSVPMLPGERLRRETPKMSSQDRVRSRGED